MNGPKILGDCPGDFSLRLSPPLLATLADRAKMTPVHQPLQAAMKLIHNSSHVIVRATFLLFVQGFVHACAPWLRPEI